MAVCVRSGHLCEQSGGFSLQISIMVQEIVTGHGVWSIAIDAYVFDFLAGSRTDAHCSPEGNTKIKILAR
jgi:hypothetical protein